MPTSATGGIHTLATTRHTRLKTFFIVFMITYSVANANPAGAGQQFQVDTYCALTISCAVRRAAVREVVRREGAERPFAASAARLAARDASHSSHVILMTSFSDESATLHLLAQRAQFVENTKVGQGGKPFSLAPIKL